MQSEEWLAKVAALGRASAALSVPRLADRLGAALAALQQCIQSGGLAAWLVLQAAAAAGQCRGAGCRMSAAALPLLPALLLPFETALGGCLNSAAGGDPSIALEQLCWLTTMCSHVLADLGDGETPLVPLPISQACEAAAAAAAGGQGGDPAEQLSAGLLAVGNHCLAHAGQVAASPRWVPNPW